MIDSDKHPEFGGERTRWPEDNEIILESSSLDARFDNFSLFPASCGVGAAEVGFEMGKPEIHRGLALPEEDVAP